MEKSASSTSSRKDDHILLCLENYVEYEGLTNGFETITIEPSLLPEVSPDEVNLTTTFLSKHINFPIIVSGMTGGTENGKVFNESVARICSEFQIGMGVGSQRAAIEDSNLIDTFKVRHIAPNVPLMANLGIAQFAKGYGVKEAKESINMIEADALAIHINPLQEIIQHEGNALKTNISTTIKELKQDFQSPIVLKGVGTGLTKVDAATLLDLDVYAIDIAGAGGTNWSRIEYYRNKKVNYLSDRFLNWGISTKDSLENIISQMDKKNVKIIASGGIWSGIDAVKALLLGADYVSLALPILRAIGKGGIDECRNYLSNYIFEMKSVMALLNLKDLEELKKERHNILDKI